MAWTEEKESIAREIIIGLYERGMIRTFYKDRPEGWKLISGLYSPFYVQLRPLISHPGVFGTVCRGMVRLIREEAPSTDRVVGIAMAGIPIAAGIALEGRYPACFSRKIEGAKTVEAVRRAIASYGEHALLEGELAPGDRLVLIDDLVTRFDSKLIAIEQIKVEADRRGIDEYDCSTVAVVLDRQQGAEETAANHDIRLLSLIPFNTVGLPLLQSVMEPGEYDVIRRYLDDPDHFQDAGVQEELRRMAGG